MDLAKLAVGLAQPVVGLAQPPTGGSAGYRSIKSCGVGGPAGYMLGPADYMVGWPSWLYAWPSQLYGGVGGPCDFSVTPVPIGLGF